MVKIENVCFNAGRKEILKDVSLTVKGGEIHGLLGPNGSGKTTLLDIIAGVKKATSGEVINEDRTGYLFQFPERNIFAETVFDEIAFWGRNLSLDNIDERVKYAMESVKLDYDKFHSRSPFLLSYGEKRKVSIASILIGEPSLILLDEPDAGLSEKSKKDIVEAILNLREKGVSFIIVSHNLMFLGELIEKIHILTAGNINYEGNFIDSLEFCKRINYKIPVKYELMSKYPEIITNPKGY